jgi:hypothetical protein
MVKEGVLSFRIDESAMKLGVRTLARLAVDWLQSSELAPPTPR